jgi:hypothetical protein
MFPHPDEAVGGDVEFWARVIPTVRYARRKNYRWGSMINGKSYKRFGGWAPIDYFSPWYSVCPWTDND